MNLKESFRYQNFLTRMVDAACVSIVDSQHCIQIKKKHLRSVVNSEASDFEEVVGVDDFPANDKVLQLLTQLLEERCKLSTAIGQAKREIGFDLDAAVETNKSRQLVAKHINCMLRNKAKKSVERGVGYKFNVDGNQAEYYYDIEVSAEEAYDRTQAKAQVRELITKADKTSSDIDAAMVNTQVDYIPPFDVNDTLEDIVAAI